MDDVVTVLQTFRIGELTSDGYDAARLPSQRTIYRSGCHRQRKREAADRKRLEFEVVGSVAVLLQYKMESAERRDDSCGL